MRLCLVCHKFTDFFEDPTESIIKVDDHLYWLWYLPRFNLVEGYHVFQMNLLSTSSRLVNSFIPKILKAFTRLHGATSQKTFVFIGTAVRNWIQNFGNPKPWPHWTVAPKRYRQVSATETDKLMVKIWSQNVTTNPVCDDEKAEFICSALLLE
jgi:hypothetical protein